MSDIEEHENDQEWNATINRLQSPIGEQFPVGELTVTLKNSKYVTKPNVFIAVLDQSGSMGGSPWNQVKAAMLYMYGLSLVHESLQLFLIPFHNFATLLKTKNVPPEEVKATINNLQAGGGNVWGSAYEEIRKILVSTDFTPETIGTVTIAFLTDGQSGEDSNMLSTKLKEILNACWPGPLSVHTVGFGPAYDRDLLEKIRMCGNIEGTFRYAELQDGDDALCQKLQSLFEIAIQGTTIPISIQIGTNCKTGSISVNSGKMGTFKTWIQLTEPDLIDTIQLTINNDVFEINVEEINDQNVYEKWISQLIDALASEILETVAVVTKNRVWYLSLDIIEQKIEFITKCTSDPYAVSRLQLLSEQVGSVRSGKAVNIGKLSDMRFGSQFGAMVTTKSTSTQSKAPTSSVQVLAITNEKVWKETELRCYNRNNTGKERNNFQEAIMDLVGDYIPSHLQTMIDEVTDEIIKHCDIDGNNALHLIAYCGHSKVMEAVLAKLLADDSSLISSSNKHDETAMTLAIKKRGFWKTIKALYNAGARIPGGRKDALEQFAINHGYKLTAKLISELSSDTGGTQINKTMTPEFIRYVYERTISSANPFDLQNYLDVMLSKGLYDLSKEMLSRGAVPTVQMFLDYCIPPIPDDPNTELYIKLAGLLLGYDPTLIKQQDPEMSTPLFKAAEKGSRPHVEFFLELDPSLVDVENNLGNTPLWIACSKRYPCIVDELLAAGADPNKCNQKGNPPMYSICQRGPLKIAEKLIAHGARIDQVNINGDTLILLCCRNGQHELLEFFMNYVSPEFVDFKAHIDGFNAIMASAEADRPECIRVLHKFNVSLEQKTADDNQIIAGATPLQIGIYYNRIESVKTLLTLGARHDVRNKDGRTPLHIAVIQGNIEIVKLLRNYKADPCVIDIFNNTPVSYARNNVNLRRSLVAPIVDSLMALAEGRFTKEEEEQAVKLLTEKCNLLGCGQPKDFVSVQDDNGTSPLMQAIIGSNFPLVSTLLKLGADPAVTNNFGLNCFFWVEYLNNIRIQQLLPKDSMTHLLVQNVKKEKKHHMLFLGVKPKETIEITGSGIESRMESFVNTIIYQPVPLQITGSVKDYGEVSSGSVEISNRLWDARVFTINTIAAGRSLGLDASEILSIALYTSTSKLSLVLNTELVQKGKTSFNQMFIGQLYSSLCKLPEYNGDFFVGTNVGIDRTKFLSGQEIIWPAFVSGSTMWKVALGHLKDFEAGKPKGTVFIVKSKTARVVAQLSMSSFDAEAITLPGTRYKITNWYRGDTICLGQANIREHTFKIKDEDLVQYVGTDKALIIELTESTEI